MSSPIPSPTLPLVLTFSRYFRPTLHEIIYPQDDGYLSEGGASFYARKIQSRIAMEKQKEVEEQRNKLRLGGGSGSQQQQQGRGGGLPEVLGGAGGLQSGRQLGGERERGFVFFCYVTNMN